MITSRPSSTPILSIQNGHSAEPMSERIVRLEPRLRRAARSLNNTSSRVVDNDDLVQNMAVALLEHPYLDVDGYVIKFAKRRAIDACRLDTIYQRYVDAMPILVDEEGDAIDYSELVPAPGGTPEDHVIAAETLAAARARLSPAQSKVLDLLLQGYSKAEIAEQLGVSRPRISQHIDSLREAFGVA